MLGEPGTNGGGIEVGRRGLGELAGTAWGLVAMTCGLWETEIPGEEEEEAAVAAGLMAVDLGLGEVEKAQG